MNNAVTYRHNVIGINSIESFASVRGGFNNNLRDVYFVRALGEDQGYANLIIRFDTGLSEKDNAGALKYKRIDALMPIKTLDDTTFYSNILPLLNNSNSIKLKNLQLEGRLLDTFNSAVNDAKRRFVSLKKTVTESIEKNFVIKLLHWFDEYVADMLVNWNEKANVKIAIDNVSKESDYLFCYFLTLLGCDVILLQNRADIAVDESLKDLSHAFEVGPFGQYVFSPYKPVKRETVTPGNKMNTASEPAGGNSQIVITLPPRGPKPGKKSTTSSTPVNTDTATAANPAKANVNSGAGGKETNAGNEKTFEELAMLASSIVMIAVHDRTGEISGTGSGIMIGEDGYILTNYHVAEGGRFYTVRIEDDDKVYATSELIKYNPALDMAIIRIDRKLTPVPIYKGRKKLARGQKVVAIGSPLGLFNSVSDGIISGFRNINDMDMIQFTAPISHGSSGGAVLNMQGEIIGISTAGIDKGQNINLAVGYESIRMFAKGFYK